MQTGHWDPPAPDPIALDKSMANVNPAALSPALNVPSNDESMHIPLSETLSFSSLSPPAHSAPERQRWNIGGYPKHLEDMIRSNTGLSDDGPLPESSSSAQANSEAGGSALAQSNRFVTMHRLPEDIDGRSIQVDLASAKASPDAKDNPDTEDDNPTNEVYRDTHLENRSEQFYTAVNNLVDDLIDNLVSDVPANDVPAETSAERLDNVLAAPANAAWVAAGQSPDWPFADYLEFEFVKWMVVNDISQTARDKLIKLPIMERCGLSFGSNYALNKLLDKLPSAGPQWTRIQRTITGTIKDAKGKPLQEDIEICVRDIVDVVIDLVRELIGNASYSHKLVFVPQRVETNGDPLKRKIDEMWTADWWMDIQKKLPPGATVVPIILSSDSTQLTNLSEG
ncbi:hypothetical protein FRC06_008645, partial [Ceratobasidium sp. 370]